LLDLWDRQDFQDLLDSLVPLAQLERQEQLDPLGLGLEEAPVQQELWATQALRDLLALLVRLDTLAQLVHLVHSDRRVLQDQQVYKDL